MPKCIHCQTDYGEQLRRCPNCGGSQSTPGMLGSEATFAIADHPLLVGAAQVQRRSRLILTGVVAGILLVGAVAVFLIRAASIGEKPQVPAGSGRVATAPRPRGPSVPEPVPLDRAVAVTEAYRADDAVVIQGTCSTDTVSRITVNGQPARLGPQGKTYRARVPFASKVEIVAESIDGESHTIQVTTTRRAGKSFGKRPRVLNVAEGQTVQRGAVRLEIETRGEKRDEPRTLDAALDSIENVLDIDGHPFRLYRAPRGFDFLRVTSTGHYTFLRRKDGQEMVLIPAGAAYRGTAGEVDAAPRHRVLLDAYMIDRTEVTCAQYARFLEYMTNGENPVLRHGEDPGVDLVPAGWNGLAPPEGWADQPVRGISWYAAWSYARWVGGHLPTEAEWERAGAGATGLAYPWGEEFDSGRCRTRAAGPVRADSMPAGEGPASLLHMSGNVREWCADRYDPRWYAVARRINPVGPPENRHRVVRGGSFSSRSEFCRLQKRDQLNPEARASDIGFRVACRYLLDRE